MEKIVGVKFKDGGKIYFFAPGKDSYEKGMTVIVDTAKGLEYATVELPCAEVSEDKLVAPLKPIVRIANQRDKEQIKKNEERRPSAIKTAQEKAEKCGLEMKVVDCEFAFDGSKVIFYFTADGRVDFRDLVKELSAVFRQRIELRQIGIRDEIKMIGGLAPCGRECCCSSCMPEVKKVSIKMAKNQGLSLNPGKISGLCGRLMCCLSYENNYYAEVCKKMPKLGSEVGTPDGKGTVVNVNMLKMEVKVKIEDKDAVSYRDYKVEELKFWRCAPDKSGDAEEKSEPRPKKITE
ncbi:MAG: stage 0 sporulation family protein [Roseburia sp.]|nr:stage 0 sporulation family protein [Roseburia sp.]